MPVTKNVIPDLIRKSLKTAEPFFVLSAFPTSELDAFLEQLWQHSRKQNKMGNNLAVLTLSFPWSESPAHALFAQIIEHWHGLVRSYGHTQYPDLLCDLSRRGAVPG